MSLFRYLTALVLALLSCDISHGSAAPRDRAIRQIDPAALAQLPTRDLQLMLADPPGSFGRRWIVWDEGVGEGQSTHVSLCTGETGCLWTRTILNAYQPAIALLGTWSDDRNSVFLLTYQFGAGAEQADIYALAARGQPRLIASRLATTVTRRLDGTIELNGTETADRVCLSPDPRTESVRSHPCRPQ